jgi:hypothetical protein
MAGRLRTRADWCWGSGGVEERSFIVKDHKFIEPLRCDECGGNAHVTRRSPHAAQDLEIRLFECHECGSQIEQIVTGESASLVARCEDFPSWPTAAMIASCPEHSGFVSQGINDRENGVEQPVDPYRLRG